jgi:glucoamylase
MGLPTASTAFGAPGIEPRWTRSTKEGIGTAYHTSCRVWFTLSHGILNEVYYPSVDCPNTRDLQFLITDGTTFCHEERRDLNYQIEYFEKGVLGYRLTNSEPSGRYRLIKEVIADPHSSVLLMRTRVEIPDKTLEGKLKIFALLSPHIKGLGQDNNAGLHDVNGRPWLRADRDGAFMVFGSAPEFLQRSAGYVGFSDGWQDINADFKMDWHFERAEKGNVALTAEVDLSKDNEFILGIAFGRSLASASTKLAQSLATTFDTHKAGFIRQWRRTAPPADLDLSTYTGDGGNLYFLSRLVLLAHEDKVYPGALVASMSIPWGETKSDLDLGGYHLVWTRDLVKSASALLATGQTATPLRSLIWIACIQEANGGVPQNSWINGDAYWHGKQLDEVAAPILLAWRLKRANALGAFDPWPLISRAAGYLMLWGPVTGQERWEENSGYSPSAIACITAALVCAADFAQDRGDKECAAQMLQYADWLSAHIEQWMTTTQSDLVPGITCHYLRITPADPENQDAMPDPNSAEIYIANGGGKHLARRIVSNEFLELVRLGVRDAKNPIIVNTTKVVDAVIKRDLPPGPGWRRYNFDGYGQKANGEAFDGTGRGNCWPLLTGERGHYELAAGKDPLPFIKALENFANEGGMLPEQVWDDADRPNERMFRGKPTGSAMPLCWAHAEYLTLVRSYKDQVGFDFFPKVYERYGKKWPGYATQMWTLNHRLPQMKQDKRLKLILSKPGSVHWSFNGWRDTTDTELQASPLGFWSVELPTEKLPAGALIQFTFHWTEGWQGRDFEVRVV